jgi:ATP-dependent exoDNAse (exonuclease V) alpha subunit
MSSCSARSSKGRRDAFEKEIADFEVRTGIALSPIQKEAVLKATRDKPASSIVLNVRRINEGLMPVAPPEDARADFYFIERSQPEAIVDTVRELLSVHIPRRFGLDRAANVNRELQALLSPKGAIDCQGCRLSV